MVLRISTKMVESLRYKFRTFGVNLEGPADIYCYNKPVVTNYSVPASLLNKKKNAICYHRVREDQSAGTLRVVWIPGEYNIADLLTKTTMTGNMRHRLVESID